MWVNVTQSKGKNKQNASRSSPQSKLLAGSCDGVRSFLSTFKTRPCTLHGCRDHRKCKYYHSTKDKRRDPYSVFYLPNDEDILSTAEYVYHPIIYLTKKCEQTSNCPYGQYCSKAHEKICLRPSAVTNEKYFCTNITEKSEYLLGTQ